MLFQMFLQKCLVSLAFWLGILSANSVELRTVSKDADPSSVACVNCTICPYPCHNMPSPGSQQGYPVYGTPPPPPPLPMVDYGAPPPPVIVQEPCPPGQVVACCQLPPPASYGYGYGPPTPLGYGPPGPYQPYESCGRPTVVLPWVPFSLSIFLIGVYLWK